VADDDVRINRFLASAGFGSRRAVETLIEQGKVSLNGKTVETLGVRVTMTDIVRVNGRPVEPEASIHVLLHKPQGVVTTAKDPEGRPTVVDLVKLPQRLFPVGRLDIGTSGAVVLTNDGALANRLMHPRYGVDKVYHATLSKQPSPGVLRRLAEGVLLEDGPTAPARVELLKASPPTIELVLHEGRNRQVRRMLEAVGHPVQTLHRPRYGGISLGTLAPGAWRFLSAGEVAALRAGAPTGRPRDRTRPASVRGSRRRTSA
jgi:pseudouridine synthase